MSNLAAVHHLEIIATGEKNSDAKGTEVWFRGLRDQRGAAVPLDQFQYGKGWTPRTVDQESVIVSTAEQPAALEWSGPATGNLSLILGSHQWSGMARIHWDGNEQVLDLFSDGGLRCIELPVEGSGAEAAEHRSHSQIKTIGGDSVIVAQSPSLWRLANPLDCALSLWRYRNLIWQFTMREFMARYKGSMLGVMWSLIVPLMLLGVYTFVFSVIFQLKWTGSTSISKSDLALRMFCALIVFNIFSETINRAPTMITNVPNYVKKVVFPLHILPVSVLGACLLQGLLNVVILFIFEVVMQQHLPPLTSFLFPLVLIPLILFTMGLAWFLASLGVFIRDIGHILVVVLQMLFYLTPIFYPIEVVPPHFRWALLLNPLTPIVEDTRSTLYLGSGMNWSWWCGVTLVSLVIWQLGYIWFMKTKRGFADVL